MARKSPAFKRLFTTANAAMELSPMVIASANIASVADGDWAVIATFGDHPSPDGAYTQHFDRAQARSVVETWNSIAGTAVRLLKNATHGLGVRTTCPIFEGHPEHPELFPTTKELGKITDLRVSDAGLEGRVTWNAAGMANRVRGPLYPSAYWYHWAPSGTPPTVYPEVLASVGLWPSPNIKGVPAWTRNTPNPLADPAENQTVNPMTELQLTELRKALGLPETATAASCISAALSAQSTANAQSILNTANAKLADEKAGVETKLRETVALLTTANANISTITGERDGLKTERDTLSTANAVLVKGILDLAEKKGAITPAEKPAFQTKLSTANTAEATAAELLTRKAMNVLPVEINGKRLDISTANARSSALQTAVSRRMADDKCDYDAAFAKVQTDPEYAALFAAMKAPAAT